MSDRVGRYVLTGRGARVEVRDGALHLTRDWARLANRPLVIPLTELEGVEFKPASRWSSGFIRFLRAGDKRGRSVSAAIAEINSVIFTPSQQAPFEKLRQALDNVLRSRPPPEQIYDPYGIGPHLVPSAERSGRKPTKADTLSMFVGVAVAGAGLAMFLFAFIPASKGTSPDQPDCRNSLSCFSNVHRVDAHIACKERITASARFDAQWDYNFMDGPFDKAGWADKEAGTITYVGDRVRLQNGLGAFVRHTYHCDFDPSRKAVVGLKVVPGQLRQ